MAKRRKTNRIRNDEELIKTRTQLSRSFHFSGNPAQPRNRANCSIQHLNV